MKMNLGILAFLFLAVGYVAGCGGGGNNNNPAVASCPANYSLINGTCQPLSSTSLAYQGSCQVGYVQTSYGCEPQGSCPVGQGFYNNTTCVPAVVSGIGTTTSCQGTCQAGYVQTLSYGCQPLGSCATTTNTCSAFYNGSCVPGITPTVGNTGFPGYPGSTYPPTAGYPGTPGYYPTTGYYPTGYTTTGYYPTGYYPTGYYPVSTGFSGGFFVW